MNVETLVACYPRLYHMAERDSWPSIKVHGLLSTRAVLDRAGVTGDERRSLEVEHRPAKIAVGEPGAQIVLRDQKPMFPDRLLEALNDGTTPSQWYEFLNARVFMWAEEQRLFGLLNAREYRTLEHDVLTIDTARLMARYADRTMLCRMNSGNTFPMPHKRGMEAFKRIADYPVKPRAGTPDPAVVEVVVEYSIPDIADYVVAVRRIQGRAVIGPLPL